MIPTTISNNPQQKFNKIWNRYRSDWVAFAKEILGCYLDSEQEEILRAVQTCKMVSVASGTARGKDFIAAVASLCFMYLTPTFKDQQLKSNTKIALTAPTGRQVSNIMIPEISRLFNKAATIIPGGLHGRLVSNGIRTKYSEWFLTGFKADEYNHEAWSGFHAVNTMFVVTEASGISQTIFDAIEGNLQGNSRILIVFNPNSSVGYAAQSQKGERWAKFRLNSLTAPNVVHKKTIIPGQVDYEWVKDKLEHWCTPLGAEKPKLEEDDFEFEGQWYRPNDLFRIKVLGKFPKVAEDVLIPQIWIEEAQKRWLGYSGTDYKQQRLIVGSDIAGMGRDSSVNCPRYGNYVEKFEKYHAGGKADHMRMAGILVNILNADKEAYVSVDTIGEGAGVYSRLVELGYEDRAVSCKYSESAKGKNDKPYTDLTGQYEFANMRAYLFWAVRDWLNPANKTGAMLPPGSGFVEEATEIKWSFRSDGKIIIEKKEDIKKRLGRSTDEFDALANTFYPISTYKLNVKAILSAFR